SARGIRSDRQHAGLSQNAAAAPVGERDAAKFVSLDSFDPVELRQLFVNEREISVEEFEHAAIFAHNGREKQLGLFLHRTAERIVEILEAAAMRRSQAQIA